MRKDMKKKFMVLALAVTLMCSLVGCGMSGGTQTSNSGTTSKIYNRDVYEFVDPDTGVHYWIYSHAESYKGMGGMTPRLNSDGSVMCDK